MAQREDSLAFGLSGLGRGFFRDEPNRHAGSGQLLDPEKGPRQGKPFLPILVGLAPQLFSVVAVTSPVLSSKTIPTIDSESLLGTPPCRLGLLLPLNQRPTTDRPFLSSTRT
jgi:hypothetical protein